MSRSQYDTDGDGSLSDEDVEWTPRDHLGRPIGIWRQSPTSGACAKPYQVFAYHNTSFRGEGSDDSRGILDAPAVRWRDTSGGGGDLTEVVSYLQDFRGDVRAVVSPTSGIIERNRYGLTGRPEAFPASDVNFDGKVDTDDSDDFAQAKKQFGNSAADYDPRADLDRDGDVDDDDEAIFNASYGDYAGYGGQWKLSAGEGLSPGVSGDKAGLDNRFGWRGYWYDSHLQVYHVRNRAYDPRQGQFLQTDPLGFSAGDQNLYRYADGNFSSGYDPLGLDEACHDAIPGRPDLGRVCSITQCGASPAPSPNTGPRGTPNPTLTGVDGWTRLWANMGSADPTAILRAADSPQLTGAQERALDRALEDVGGRLRGSGRAVLGLALAVSTIPTGIGPIIGIDQTIAGLRQAFAEDPREDRRSGLNVVLTDYARWSRGFSDPQDTANKLEVIFTLSFGAGRGSRPGVIPAEPMPSRTANESVSNSGECPATGEGQGDWETFTRMYHRGNLENGIDDWRPLSVTDEPGTPYHPDQNLYEFRIPESRWNAWRWDGQVRPINDHLLGNPGNWNEWRIDPALRQELLQYMRRINPNGN